VRLSSQSPESQMEFEMSFFQIPADKVPHFDVFQVSPTPLDGVQVWGVRW